MEKSQHTELYRKLALELKVARVRAGLTQRDVSKKLKTYQSYTTKVESAERKIDVVELQTLCQLYGMKVSELLKLVGIE